MGKLDYPPPLWAMNTAKPGDRDAAARAHQRGTLKTNWDVFRAYGFEVNIAGGQKIDGPPTDWAQAQGWPTPWFSFRSAFLTKMLESFLPHQDARELFLTKMLESDENFDLAVTESGVKVYFPKKEHTLSENDLKDLDAMYEATDGGGRRPTRWRYLVGALREIRRAVEAGVAVKVEGKTLRDFDSFYTWAHGRYHALEDGYDSWIGDDET